MRKMHFKNLSFVFLTIICFNFYGKANYVLDESHMKVAMRMIGHEVLKNFGDSTSLVLPIQTEGERYRISLDAQIRFEPSDFVTIVNRVAEKANLPKSYIVEVVRCDNDEIVYSYEVGVGPKESLIPCGDRSILLGCYSILFTPLSTAVLPVLEEKDMASKSKSTSNYNGMFLLIPFVLFIGWGAYARRKKKDDVADINTIPMGKFMFNKTSMHLLFDEEKIELTSKEADLLSLLHNSVNDTIKRETILEKVWGDEGDYVGRTLDVFISKLRKKLEADPQMKIANIRGVGYRLILEK